MKVHDAAIVILKALSEEAHTSNLEAALNSLKRNGFPKLTDGLRQRLMLNEIKNTQDTAKIVKVSNKSLLRNSEKLLKKNDFEAALSICNDILKIQPKNLQAIRLQDKIRTKTKQQQVHLSRKLNQLEKDQKYDEIVNVCRSQSKIVLSELQILNSYSKALHRLDMIMDALELLSLMEEYFSGNSDFYHNYGIFQLGINKNDAEKKFLKAIELDPKRSDSLLRLGIIYVEQKAFSHAITYLEKAYRQRPKDETILKYLGYALLKDNRNYYAIKVYEEYNLIAPNRFEVLNNLGRAFQKVRLYNKALACFSECIKIDPQSHAAHYNIGSCYLSLGNTQQALSTFTHASSINNDDVDTLISLGNLHEFINRPTNALEFYTRALGIDPKRMGIQRNVALLTKYRGDEKHIRTLLDLKRDPSIVGEDRVDLLFSLAKVYDDLKRYDTAFRFIKKANSLRKNLLNYSIDQDQLLFSLLHKKFNDNPYVDINLGSQFSSELIPVFIVGMPRSGTTLLETILSGHPMFQGLGELSYLEMQVSELDLINKDFDAVLCRRLRDEYLERFLPHVDKAKYAIDKMPLNFRFLPFAINALPEAKFIHIRRDPIAVCWSIYKTRFVSRGNQYAHDLNDLVNYMGLYNNLMNSWEHLYPEKILSIDYEDLTSETTPTVKKCCEFLGITWNSSMVKIENNDRFVKTASSSQIRKDIYTNSNQSWKRYEAHLNPLIEAFDK